jgi:transcriptional regulator with XRE-family HTH domain
MTKNEFLTDPRPIGEQIADRAKSLGVSVSEICRRAGVMPYQVTQWKKHDPAGISGLRRIESAFQDLEIKEKAWAEK